MIPSAPPRTGLGTGELTDGWRLVPQSAADCKHASLFDRCQCLHRWHSCEFCQQ